MNRIDKTMVALAEANRCALVSYVVAGDPDEEDTVPLMHELVKSGTDIIELGVPFSDPAAEGPVIQLGHERALKNGIGLKQVLSMVESFRQNDSDTPVVLMGYANPIEWMGYSPFCSAAQRAGADAALVVDLPPEESREFTEELSRHGLANIYLIAPTTSEERIQKICDQASGFIYYVSVKGVTGSAELDVTDVEGKLKAIRARTTLPICVGFGIKDGASARAVAAVADGVVVGSAFVDLLAQASDAVVGQQAVGELVAELRSAIDQL